MFKKVSLFAVLAMVLFLTGCAADKSGDAMEKKGDAMMMEKAEIPDVVKIGMIGPLTGNAAAYGQDMKRGIEVFFEDNPTIDGKTVEVIYEDGKCNGQDAANAAQKLISVDKVEIILGGVCSGETLALAPIAEQNKVVVLSPGSSSPEITTAGDYIFRNYPSDDLVAMTLVEFVTGREDKMALLTEQTDYAQGYRGAVKKHLEAAGRSEDLVLDEAFGVDNTDFRTLLTKVKESGATGLIIVGQSPVTDGFAVKQAAELGLDIQIYGTDTMPGNDFFETAKDATEGVFAIYVTEDPTRSGYTEFVEKRGEAQGADIFAALGYDAAQIAAKAIAEVGYDATNIKNYFYQMDTFAGIATDVNFDEFGDNNAPAGVQIVKDGKFVPFTE